MIIKGATAGLLSGIMMGLFMKLLEAVSDKKVYTLLLNIDFIPIIREQEFTELAEFILHLFIAVLIGIIFAGIIERFEIQVRSKRFLLSLALTFPTIFLYFPLTILAIKVTPPASDFLALTLWIIAHLAFALFLPISYHTPKINKENNSLCK